MKTVRFFYPFLLFLFLAPARPLADLSSAKTATFELDYDIVKRVDGMPESADEYEGIGSRWFKERALRIFAYTGLEVVEADADAEVTVEVEYTVICDTYEEDDAEPLCAGAAIEGAVVVRAPGMDDYLAPFEYTNSPPIRIYTDDEFDPYESDGNESFAAKTAVKENFSKLLVPALGGAFGELHASCGVDECGCNRGFMRKRKEKGRCAAYSEECRYGNVYYVFEDGELGAIDRLCPDHSTCEDAACVCDEGYEEKDYKCAPK